MLQLKALRIALPMIAAIRLGVAMQAGKTPDRMKHVICIGFSVSNQTKRTAAIVQVASLSLRERGRVRVAPSEYPASLGKTPHLNPLPLPQGRGVAKQSADARL